MGNSNVSKRARKDLTSLEKRKRWEQWLTEQGQVLTTLGLPGEILSDEEHWLDFCAHGYLHNHPSTTGFSAHDLGLAEARRLFDFLRHYLSPQDQSDSHLILKLTERISNRE